MQKADLVIRNIGQLVTMAGPARARIKTDLDQFEVICDGCLVVRDGVIAAVGTEKILDDFDLTDAETVDAHGQLVTPGLVDPHVHLVFDGWRQEDLALKLEGLSYMEIAARGGNDVLVNNTRNASEERLCEVVRKTLDRMVENGTTTAEAKSGRGLTVESEIKQLRVIKKLNETHVIDLVPTFLGAHYVPKEYAGRQGEYVDLVIDEMMPIVEREHLAEFCDVWCEVGEFTVEESRRVLNAGKAHGMLPRIHADELESTGGAELAAEVGAVSAEHLLRISDEGIAAMAKAGVIANLLPGTPFYLMMDQYAPVRKMLDAGVPVALATDFNPNTSPTESLQPIMNLASIEMRMTAKEIMTAVTINAAYAVNRGSTVGSLEVGKLADIVLWDAPDMEFLMYHFGVNLADKVFKKGCLVAEHGALLQK